MVKIRVLSRMPFFGESRERKTFDKILEHVATTYEAVSELDKALEAFQKEDGKILKEKLENVDLLEKKGDRLRRSIEEDLYSGAFLPISRSRILDFAENVDKVSDTAEDASKLLPFLGKDDVPDELVALLRDGVRKAMESVKLLRDGIDSIEDLAKIRDIINRIRAKEHESDEISYKAYAFLYGRKYDARAMHLTAKLIEFISNISDTAEDASDSLSLIVLMHKI
jgi:predicted phosphate transport protein (TIGR00153 family)